VNKTYAIVIDGIVENIIVTDDHTKGESDLGVKLIEYTSLNPAHLGLGHDAKTKKFAAPPVIEPINSEE